MNRPPSAGFPRNGGFVFFAAAFLLAGTAARTAPPDAANQKPRLAVAPLRASNVAAEDAAVLADTLRSALVGTGAFRMVDRAQMEQILGEQRFQLLGVTNEAEAARLGRVLNVQEMVFGTVSRLDDTYYLTVTAISIETAEIRASESVEARSLKKLRAKLRTTAKGIAKSYEKR
jgi:hypothetical protein